MEQPLFLSARVITQPPQPAGSESRKNQPCFYIHENGVVTAETFRIRSSNKQGFYLFRGMVAGTRGIANADHVSNDNRFVGDPGGAENDRTVSLVPDNHQSGFLLQLAPDSHLNRFPRVHETGGKPVLKIAEGNPEFSNDDQLPALPVVWNNHNGICRLQSPAETLRSSLLT
jgi:hypothetical protein